MVVSSGEVEDNAENEASDERKSYHVMAPAGLGDPVMNQTRALDYGNDVLYYYTRRPNQFGSVITSKTHTGARCRQ